MLAIYILCYFRKYKTRNVNTYRWNISKYCWHFVSYLKHNIISKESLCIAIHSLIIGELITVYSLKQTLKLKQILLTRSRKQNRYLLTYIITYLFCCWLTVLTPTDGSCFVSSQFSDLRSPLMSSLQTTDTGCGSPQMPWVVEVEPGQQINFTLVDFTSPSNASQHSNRCPRIFMTTHGS